jgi:hypothetical protein
MAKSTEVDLIQDMKETIKSSGGSKKDIFYVGADSKRRVRFLQELTEGLKLSFHAHWERGLNALCGMMDGDECPYCDTTDDELRETMKTVTMYAFSVWDYDANAVRILLYKATGASPIPWLLEFNGEFGTIKDRDYTIKKIGKGQGSSIAVLSAEVSPFRNKKAIPFTKKQTLKLLRKAHPFDEDDVEQDEDDEPKKKSSKAAKSSKSSKGSAGGKKKEEKKQSPKAMLKQLTEEELRDIAIEFGVSKKELKGLDKAEIIELLISDYEEDDVVEACNNILESREDEDEDEEDDEDDDDDDE